MFLKIILIEKILVWAFSSTQRYQGLEIPTSAIADMVYRPSQTFAPASAEGLIMQTGP